jgi:hypothetical protein
MIKVKTGRENYLKKLLHEYHTGGFYQPYLKVKYLTEEQISKKTRPKQNITEVRTSEIQVIYESIKKVYLRIIYNRRITKSFKFIYEKSRPEIVILD